MRLTLAVVVLLLAGCGRHAASFTNPVYDADFPDPFILKAGDTYYAYATNGAGREVQTLASKDLVHWTPGADALPQVGAWGYNGKTWAPEVLARKDGTYVLYYTANGGGQCIGRAVSSSPAGPFVDHWRAPLVCQRTEGGSIDPSPFRDGDGSLYLYWKNDGNSIGHTTHIYVQPLSADGTRLVGHAKPIESNDAGWEGGVVEGPMMWTHDDRYYLFYSGNAYDSPFYAVGYATCESPLGPCRDAPGNPILKTACRASGPGHNAIVEAGGRTWIAYHAWPSQSNADKRVLWLDRLRWIDGKPHVDGPTCDAQVAP